MASWFKRLQRKSSQSPNSSRRPLGNPPPAPSLTSHLEQNSNTLAIGLMNGPKQTSCASPVNISSSNSARWNKLYDVCICHSEGDLEFVEQMVSYLESQAERFRCFLQLRDAVPGGAVVSELCEAVQNSHCWVLLITSGFLKDPWCVYQMHQALMEAPMANGRIIPVLKDVDCRDYPRELKGIYYIKVTVQENSFGQVKETVMRCNLISYYKAVDFTGAFAALEGSVMMICGNYVKKHAGAINWYLDEKLRLWTTGRKYY